MSYGIFYAKFQGFLIIKNCNGKDSMSTEHPILCLHINVCKILLDTLKAKTKYCN